MTVVIHLVYFVKRLFILCGRADGFRWQRRRVGDFPAAITCALQIEFINVCRWNFTDLDLFKLHFAADRGKNGIDAVDVAVEVVRDLEARSPGRGKERPAALGSEAL